MSPRENRSEQLLDDFVLANNGLTQFKPHLVTMLSKFPK
jgi:hypothetical protein